MRIASGAGDAFSFFFSVCAVVATIFVSTRFMLMYYIFALNDFKTCFLAARRLRNNCRVATVIGNLMSGVPQLPRRGRSSSPPFDFSLIASPFARNKAPRFLAGQIS